MDGAANNYFVTAAGRASRMRSVKKHFQERTADLSITLRSGRDDKGKAVPPGTVAAEQEPFCSILGGRKQRSLHSTPVGLLNRSGWSVNHWFAFHWKIYRPGDEAFGVGLVMQ
jgi:hypothetical protein